MNIAKKFFLLLVVVRESEVWTRYCLKMMTLHLYVSFVIAEDKFTVVSCAIRNFSDVTKPKLI